LKGTCQLKAWLQILSSYGIAGDISIPAVNEYFREVSLSLLHPTDPFSTGLAVHYCSPLPPSRTPQGADRATNGLDFLQHLAVHSTECPSGAEVPHRRRDEYQGGGHEDRLRELEVNAAR
jgi:hypothetical protein